MSKIFFPLIFSFFIICISCSNKKGVYSNIAGFAQGTTYHITYELPENRDLTPEVDSILKAFDKSLSSYDSTSIISKINRNEDVESDQFFTTVFNTSADVFKDSDGLFDITVMPLVNLWGFGPGHRGNPDPAVIDSILGFIGMEKVKLINNKIVKSDSRIQLDVNALAQGYSVDIVCDYFDHLGSENYLIEIGGEIRAKGVNVQGLDWRIGIDKPEFGNMVPGAELQAIVRLKNKSLATSGNYRKFYEENGIKYTHSLNPHTGYPAKQSLLSATIIADECIIADAYATVCMVAGLEKSREILSRHPELDAYLIYSDSSGYYNLFITDRMKKMIEEE